MERRAEINRFAIFLFCLLVPLGSLAPTETSKESKTTTELRQKRSTTSTKPVAPVIEKRANTLFDYYQKCISGIYHAETWTLESQAGDMVKKIPDCLPFHANCCALHHIHNTLKALRSDIETICNNSSKEVKANIIQLETTLNERDAFYTCRTEKPPQSQTLTLAEKMVYIWGVLKKYQEIMQNPKNLHSKAAA